jgi:hypothetical protein
MEKLLQEELKRFNAINKYTEKLLSEQEPPLPPPAAGEDPAALPPPPAGADTAAPLPAAGADPAAPPADVPPPEAEDKGTDVGDVDPAADDTTEELDITDLVNMTKSIKKQLDDTQGQDNGSTQKLDDVFTKLNDLESRLGEMDNVLAKIDQLGAQIQQVKPKTPMEKLEMRSLDSYPFSKSPDQFFSEKQDEMQKSGKNEYVLTKGDVENYGKYDVMKSFNPNIDKNTF